MLKIVICDDKEREIQNTASLVKECLQEIDEANDYTLSCYSSSIELLSKTKEVTFDIFILDIIMPEKDGISLAKELLINCPNARIIFLSTTSEFVYDAFSLKAVHYLLKPCQKEQLIEALERALVSSKESPSKKVIIRNVTGIVLSIDVDDFIYAESYGRKCRICSMNPESNDVILNCSLSELYVFFDKLPQIIRCGASYFVNIDNIVNLTKNVANMRNEETIYIPRRVYPEFMKQYSDYYGL